MKKPNSQSGGLINKVIVDTRKSITSIQLSENLLKLIEKSLFKIKEELTIFDEYLKSSNSTYFSLFESYLQYISILSDDKDKNLKLPDFIVSRDFYYL